MNSIADKIKDVKQTSLQKLNNKSSEKKLTAKCILATWKLAIISYNEINSEEKIRSTAINRDAGVFRKQAEYYFPEGDERWVEFLQEIVLNWKYYLQRFDWMTKSPPPPVPNLQFIAIHIKYFIDYSQEHINIQAHNDRLAEEREPSIEDKDKIISELRKDLSCAKNRMELDLGTIKELRRLVSTLDTAVTIEAKATRETENKLGIAESRYKTLLAKAEALGYDKEEEDKEALEEDYELPEYQEDQN